MTRKAQDKETLGLIAGGGAFPLMVAEAAREKGFRVVAVAHVGETDPLLAEKVDELAWVKLGQLGHLIKVLKKAGVTKTVMAGSINKKKMFENVRPDLRGLTLMSKLAIFHDDDILRAVAGELGREGIDIVSSAEHLPELLAPRGNLTRKKPNKEEREDVEFGWKIAKELGRLDIGQCVVVRKKTVLALEAIEGTNETSSEEESSQRKRRGCKSEQAEPGSPFRRADGRPGNRSGDVAGQRLGLGIEAGKTLIFDKHATISYADRLNIAILSL